LPNTDSAAAAADSGPGLSVRLAVFPARGACAIWAGLRQAAQVRQIRPKLFFFQSFRFKLFD
jgi:hypothetical protein